ncbi:hypothetical protein D3H55_00290 [Bacillus salacetis]|uniref:Uncharacterized protein n=1 Tax=Bacillus salacetis TaxID=2315464 RepID=A0A3A1R6L5_9BACI|nr:hypothetical protein [Bacillus salacetis]RIW38831.1 hypothetical protein D3H55_00290 [Bacillus salacetis]
MEVLIVLVLLPLIITVIAIGSTKPGKQRGPGRGGASSTVFYGDYSDSGSCGNFDGGSGGGDGGGCGGGGGV